MKKVISCEYIEQEVKNAMGYLVTKDFERLKDTLFRIQTACNAVDNDPDDKETFVPVEW